MKKTAFVMLCLIFFVLVGTSFAAVVSRLGPNQYIRTSGSPDIFTDSFTAIPGEGMLTVKNGAIDGSDRITDAISSASVFLNGVEIFGTNDFNQNVYLLESPVDLTENNSITVELGSNPESFLTIEVTQEQQQEGPAVALSADPENIPPQGISHLTWTSTNADTCVIEPTIGTVDLNGSIEVSPTETTTYTITATGPGGTETASVTVVVTPMVLSFISPLDGDTISRPDIMVHGIIINPLGNEVGVNVNGILAQVYGDQFVANHVPLEEGENTITAIATDVDGNTATASITIDALTTGNYLRITADTASGVSPFETTLEVEGSFSFPQASISHTGPGTVEFLDSADPKEYNARMTTPGIYFFTGEATDEQSNTYTDTIAVFVLDKAQLDALLGAKWGGMKTALEGGDIEKAVGYFSQRSRAVFQQQFIALSPILPQIAEDMGEINLLDVRENHIVYDLRTIRSNETYSFQLLFVRDEDGIWRIRNF